MKMIRLTEIPTKIKEQIDKEVSVLKAKGYFEPSAVPELIKEDFLERTLRSIVASSLANREEDTDFKPPLIPCFVFENGSITGMVSLQYSLRDDLLFISRISVDHNKIYSGFDIKPGDPLPHIKDALSGKIPKQRTNKGKRPYPPGGKQKGKRP